MTAETQRQRTQLSWRRTLLSALVVEMLFSRFVLEAAPPAFMILGAVLWITLFVLARHRIGAVDRPIGRTLPLVSLLVVAYSVTSAVLVLHIA